MPTRLHNARLHRRPDAFTCIDRFRGHRTGAETCLMSRRRGWRAAPRPRCSRRRATHPRSRSVSAARLSGARCRGCSGRRRAFAPSADHRRRARFRTRIPRGRRIRKRRDCFGRRRLCVGVLRDQPARRRFSLHSGTQLARQLEPRSIIALTAAIASAFSLKVSRYRSATRMSRSWALSRPTPSPRWRWCGRSSAPGPWLLASRSRKAR